MIIGTYSIKLHEKKTVPKIVQKVYNNESLFYHYQNIYLLIIRLLGIRIAIAIFLKRWRGYNVLPVRQRLCNRTDMISKFLSLTNCIVNL